MTEHRVHPLVAPVLGGGALAGAAAIVALNDPAARGSHFPGCIFHATTGLWCPGCGLTRGVHQLLTGHPMAALGENIFVPFAVIVVVVTWWAWMRRSLGRPPLHMPPRVAPALSVVLPAALVVYGVLRNIPHAPFTALAP